MKLFTFLVFLLSLNAHSSCLEKAREVAVDLALTSFPDHIPSVVRVKFDSYSGFHQKKYIVEVPFKTVKETEVYSVKIFEFESPSTDCIVDEITRVTAAASDL